MLSIKDILAECLSFAEDNDINFYYSFSAIGSQLRLVIVQWKYPSFKPCLAARLFLEKTSKIGTQSNGKIHPLFGWLHFLHVMLRVAGISGGDVSQ